MANKCAICGAEINLIQTQKLQMEIAFAERIVEVRV